MESQNDSVIPEIISRQESLFVETMVQITNMVDLMSDTFDDFGENIANIKERD